MEKINILIIDDEPAQRQILMGFLQKKGYNVFEASNGKDGIETVTANSIDIILTDNKMPGITGIQLLARVKKINPLISVVLITAFGTIEQAVKAMKEGAYDYLTKPIDLDELELLLGRIIERKHLLDENEMLKRQLIGEHNIEGIIAKSKKMQEILSIAARVAPSKASVLITGESGTGKELIAKAIHFSSDRKNRPFIAVNCAALNENLLESELFGHEKGAFTGADKQRIGRFEAADGSTIFLDEIGDIPLSTQVKLLRILQESKFERVGSSQTIEVNVRLITATNKNLTELIQKGDFREDLYYRLNVVQIELPPLRERKEDILPLIDFCIKKYSPAAGKEIISFSREAMDYMLKYNYPGNIRELENIVQKAIVLKRGNIIQAEDVMIDIKSKKDADSLDLSQRIESLEQELIDEALKQSNGNQTKAAKILGISESNLRYRINKAGKK